MAGRKTTHLFFLRILIARHEPQRDKITERFDHASLISSHVSSLCPYLQFERTASTAIRLGRSESSIVTHIILSYCGSYGQR